MIGIGDIAYVLGLRSAKLHRWYQDVLSGFKQAKQAGLIGKDDIVVKEKRVEKKMKVPISNKAAVGAHMAIDEKEINGDYYMILSNRVRGKITLMVKALKSQEVLKAVHVFGNENFEVRTITRDLVYYSLLAFRKWMDKDQIGETISLKREQLSKWCDKADEENIEELSNFVSTLKTHDGVILNYFKFGATNACAEALNRILKGLLVSIMVSEIPITFSTA